MHEAKKGSVSILFRAVCSKDGSQHVVVFWYDSNKELVYFLGDFAICVRCDLDGLGSCGAFLFKVATRNEWDVPAIEGSFNVVIKLFHLILCRRCIFDDSAGFPVL